MKNADMPAMPSGIEEGLHNSAQEPLNIGLTKREHFAAMAMQGLLASPDTKYADESDIARDSALCADALLAELERTNA